MFPSISHLHPVELQRLLVELGRIAEDQFGGRVERHGNADVHSAALVLRARAPLAGGACKMRLKFLASYSMSLTLRPGKPEDAAVCGLICCEAFKTIAEQHTLPSHYPSPEVAVVRMEERLSHLDLYAIVAELDEQVIGSNFLDERGPIVGLGPITVAPTVQNRTIGQHLSQGFYQEPMGAFMPSVLY